MRNAFLLFAVLSFFSGNGQESTSAPNFFTSFDGTKIHYEVIGTGKPVILIHGFIVNSESWKRTSLYKELPDAGYQVITVDLRGNGKSDKPHKPEAYEKDAEAKDIIRLATHLKLETYSVVGYSRGSIIASRLIVLDGKRVHAAVLGGMGDEFTDPNWPRRIMFYEALSGKAVNKEMEPMLKYVKDAGLDQEVLAYMQKGQPSTSKEELDNVKHSVLVICGTEDDDNGAAQKLSALIPKSKFVNVPGFHHDANNTPEFSAEIIKFLDHHTKK